MTAGASWSGRERNCCFVNTTDGRFADASAVSGLDFADDGRSLVVTDWDGVLIMNPGSPTYPGRKHKRGVLGTIGILEINGEDATARIVNLEGS